MAGSASVGGVNPLIAGAFGSLQTTSAARADTATVWADLRQTVGSYVLAAQGVAQPYDPAAVDLAGRAALSAQGVGIAEVNQGRALAGQWRSAREALQGLESGQQITSSAIFQPPWAITAESSVPSRYRVRSQWQFIDEAGAEQTQWRADELTGPLTTVPDALAQAEPNANTQSGRAILASGAPPVLTDYEIEQV